MSQETWETADQIATAMQRFGDRMHGWRAPAAYGVVLVPHPLTLRNLERDGLLERTVYPTVPPQVDYTATKMARELYDYFLGLTAWAERHRGAIASALETYDNVHQ